jgi:glycosyltransferase involved in cell wall biosynthesis
MKIAFMYHAFQLGSGPEQVILDLARHLKLIGHDTMIITYSNERNCGIPVMEFGLPVRTPGDVVAPISVGINEKIRRVLDGFDVVVTSLYPMSIVPLWPRKIKPKVVFVEWGLQPYSAFSSLKEKAYMWLLNRADRFAIKRSDMVIVANDVTKRWVEDQGVNPVKLNLYGINFDRLAVVEDCAYLYRRHRELSNARGILMYVGRQSPHKNIEILIRAMALLKYSGYNAKLLIVGKESFTKYAGWLKGLVRSLALKDDVVFTGLVSEEDLMGYYSMCDIFVNASRWEGFLNPEPYAFRKPIIAYGIKPHDETVQDEITGLLVENLTPACFAQSMGHLLTHRRVRLAMGEAGYQWAKEHLDYKVIAQKFIDTIGNK